MSDANKKKFDYQLLGRVLGLARPYRTLFALAGILAVVLAPIATLRPYLVQVMVDDYIFNYDLPGLTRMALLFI